MSFLFDLWFLEGYPIFLYIIKNKIIIIIIKIKNKFVYNSKQIITASDGHKENVEKEIRSYQ